MGHKEVVPTLTEIYSGVLGVGQGFVFVLYALFNLKHAIPHGYLTVPQKLLAS
jgi:hypothetical protein